MHDSPASPHITILLEHQDFIIIDKPGGIAMHDADEGIISILEAQYGHRCYLVHRLDTPTSGCLLLAKSAASASSLSSLFAKREIQKYYLALAGAAPAFNSQMEHAHLNTSNNARSNAAKKAKKKQGSIIGDMAKARGGSYKLLKSRSSPAITQFISHSLAPNLRAYLCKPISGKTHQIRVAMKSNSSPILGDKRYGPNDTSADRLYLHAYALAFTYKGEAFKVINAPQHERHGTLFSQHYGALPKLWQNPWDMTWPKVNASLALGHKPLT